MGKRPEETGPGDEVCFGDSSRLNPTRRGFPISMPDLPEAEGRKGGREGEASDISTFTELTGCRAEEDEQSEQSEEQGEVEAAAVPGGQSA